MGSSAGPDFARLLLYGFEAMAEEARSHLSRAGHDALTVGNELAMQAITGGADSAAELARALAVTRQAAAKTIDVLNGLGYIERARDATDARRKHLVVTDRGREAVAAGAGGFTSAFERWCAVVGPETAAATIDALRHLAASRGNDAPAHDVG